MSMRPNLSIERTPSSKLRLREAAAHVKRYVVRSYVAAAGEMKCVASCNFQPQSREIPRSTPGGEIIQANWER